jgi:putative colanic acid biosynthesis acetyltransferase WcaF
MSSRAPLETKAQDRFGGTPWSKSHRYKAVLWNAICPLLFRPAPKPLHRWRRRLLTWFGCTFHGGAYVDASARITYPWHLTLHQSACIGHKAEIYNLGHITLGKRCVVAQQAYLCTGTHDLEHPKVPLQTAPIVIGDHAFIGVRALIMPGVTVGEGAVVGGGAVVTKDVEPWTIVAGNPAKPIKTRDSDKYFATADANTPQRASEAEVVADAQH